VNANSAHGRMITPTSADVRLFVFDTLFVMAGFIVVLGAVVVMDIFAAYLEAGGVVPGAIAWVPRGLAYVVLIGDIVWFGTVLMVESWHFFRTAGDGRGK
jgi:hypothetical protein